MGRDRPRITVVGLGPAGEDHLTTKVREVMAHSRRTFLRTERHPAATVANGAETFDHLYESADTFEDVYRSIVEVLVAAAAEEAPEPVVYAVPGSPLVAERTVELLRVDSRVEVTIIPSLSFLDLAWERLGVDPLSTGVQLVDAESFEVGVGGGSGPFLVAQCWSKPTLSVVKLSLDLADNEPAPEAVFLHHLGLPDERVVRVSWWDLDRTLVPDHLTSLYIPLLPQRPGLPEEMARLDDLVHTLRARCPWDRAQTHGTLMPHLVEESYEVLDALRVMDTEGAAVAPDGTAAQHLEEELGDLLFQIVFHARLAEEAGSFTLADVARTVHDKLVHRHPHVFGDVQADTADQVVTNWEAIKKEEKGRSSVTEGIPTALPALLFSTKLVRKAMSVGLPDPAETEKADLPEQLVLLCQAHEGERTVAADGVLTSVDPLERLVGDVLFGVASLARRAGIDPEQALRARALEYRESIIRQEETHRPDTAAPATP